LGRDTNSYFYLFMNIGCIIKESKLLYSMILFYKFVDCVLLVDLNYHFHLLLSLILMCIPYGKPNAEKYLSFFGSSSPHGC